MKSLILIFAFLVTSLSFAQTSQWKKISSEQVKGENPQEIYEIFLGYSKQTKHVKEDILDRIAAGFEDVKISKIELSIETLRWEGPTTCPPSDPRLQIMVTNGSTCYESTGDSVCYGWINAIEEADPCAAKLEKTKKIIKKTY